MLKQKDLLTEQIVSCSRKGNDAGKRALIETASLDGIRRTDDNGSIYKQHELLFIRQDRERTCEDLEKSIAKNNDERSRYEPMTKTFQERLKKCDAEIMQMV